MAKAASGRLWVPGFSDIDAQVLLHREAALKRHNVGASSLSLGVRPQSQNSYKNKLIDQWMRLFADPLAELQCTLGDGFYENPVQPCSFLYVTCSGGVSRVMTCADQSLRFDRLSQRCLHPEHVTRCGGKATTTERPTTTSAAPTIGSWA